MCPCIPLLILFLVMKARVGGFSSVSPLCWPWTLFGLLVVLGSPHFLCLRLWWYLSEFSERGEGEREHGDIVDEFCEVLLFWHVSTWALRMLTSTVQLLRKNCRFFLQLSLFLEPPLMLRVVLKTRPLQWYQPERLNVSIKVTSSVFNRMVFLCPDS